jgi:hypothetical protein
MKTIAWFLGACICAVLVLWLSANNKARSIGSTRVFWTDRDIEGSKIDPEFRLRVVSETIPRRLKFYPGTLPLEFAAYVEDIISPQLTMGEPSGLVVLEQYGEFRNMYVYSDSFNEKLRGVAIGAITMSDSGELLAEAKLISRTADGIEIEEEHYDSCRQGSCALTFKATSIIDRSGTKQAEHDSAGRKSRDHYFQWPMGML